MSLWDQILDGLARIVSPDWGALVTLIPVAVAALVLLYFVLLARRASMVGPRQRLPAPTPIAPAGVHLPGPSAAPILAAIGAFCLLATLVLLQFGPRSGPDGKPLPDSGSFRIADVTIGSSVIPGWLFLAIGIAAMVLALVVWLREANRDYRAIEPAQARAATAHAGPPPGVHVPGPSFRPLLVSIGGATMLLGLAVGPILLLAGMVMFAVALAGWLRDAEAEYRLTVRADATGHLESVPAPGFPIGTFFMFAVLFVGALVVVTGVFPPRGGTAGGGTAARTPPLASTAPGTGGGSPAPGSPAPSGAPGSPAPSGAPGSPAPSGSAASPGPSGQPAVTLKITAQGIAYDTAALSAPAGVGFAIDFTNNDAGTPHNVEIRDASGATVFHGDIFSGPDSRTYQVQALPAGAYKFVCSVHPNMVGTLTVQ